MKAILFIALLGLSLAVAHSNNQEVVENDLHFNLGHAVGSVGHFIEKNKGAIQTGIKIGTMIASLGLYENQEETPEIHLATLTNILSSDELHFNIGHAIGDVGHFIEKNKGAIQAGIKIGTMIASLGLYEDQQDNELFNLNGLLNDGLKTVGDATKQHPDYVSLINDGINIIKDITQKNQLFADNELFNFKGAVHNVVEAGKHGVDYALQHPDQIVKDAKAGIEIYKALSGLRNNGLFNLNGLINDGLKTFGDATKQNPDLGTLINDGIHIFTDFTQNQLFNEEDNELFDFKGVVHNVVQAGKNEVGYALQHPDQIVNDVKAGVEIYKTLSGLRNNGLWNLNGLINDGLKTFGDATKQNPDLGALINDGIHIFNDIAQNQLHVEEKTFLGF